MADSTTTFQPGDVVQLKSGGPLFTVARLANNGNVFYYYINKAGLIEEYNIAVLPVALKKASIADMSFSPSEPDPSAGGAF
ncbi:MAG: DUF2158 domain-containing protein [Hymenobacter sp.]|nr:MAG: DUF2158 domain-containing protein [Hymenobacter sp.]